MKNRIKSPHFFSIIIGIILSISQYYSIAQQSKIDSLFEVLKSAKDTIKIYTELGQIADYKYNNKEFEHAAQFYEKAFELNPKKELNLIYNAACSWALSGYKENALKDLNVAIDHGFTDMDYLKMDKDLISLYSEQGWTKLFEKYNVEFSKKKYIYFKGVIFGIMIILFFYNLFLFFSIRDFSLLYFSLFILFGIHYQIFFYPSFGIYIYNLFPWLNCTGWINNKFIFFVSIAMIFYLLFVRSFLSLRGNFKKLDISLKIMIVYSVFNALISIKGLYVSKFFYRPIPFIIVVLIIFFISIFIFIKGFKPAKYFIIANTAFTIGVILNSSRAYDFIHVKFRIYNFEPDQIGFILFLALLSFAIGDKINSLKAETIKAQVKALEILEEKVQERTKEIQQKNIALEQQNEEIRSQSEEIEAQRDALSHRKDEIISSIQYAQRIQHAVLPDDEIIKENLPEFFVLYKPRDIVSGDFYWFKKVKNFALLATADCTGHGVPGAFMSMLGISLLNEIVGKSRMDTAGEILNNLRKKIKTALHQHGKNMEQKDGMDIALCIFDLENNTMQFAGAYNSLYLVRNNQLIEFKADRQPCAVHIQESDFTTHEIKIQKDDIIYTFSDGYADQYGGENRKKYLAKNFRNYLLSISHEPMEKQKELLDSNIESWKNGKEQIDDITVIGVKI